MADVQSEFRQFHETIQLSWNNEGALLRTRRDRVLDRLRTGLEQRRAAGAFAPRFDVFNQGSYAMGTGVTPIDGEYDIDVGLRFRTTREECPDPRTLKQLVHDIVSPHTQDVRAKGPCVTVNYVGDFHVDLAIYATEGDVDYLARGHIGSPPERRIWEESGARSFIDRVQNHLSGEDREQFRRTIRYLKRWRDHCFRTAGNEAPVGIGLTLNALGWFVPQPEDLAALIHLVRQMHGGFSYRPHEERNELPYGQRLVAHMPVAPRDDVYDRMSNRQMELFRTRLGTLLDALLLAWDEPDPHEACVLLREQFGDDFPVPEPGTHARRSGAAAVVTSSSFG